jgi:hypothetical protein
MDEKTLKFVEKVEEDGKMDEWSNWDKGWTLRAWTIIDGLWRKF